jgi:hypothetical protein
VYVLNKKKDKLYVMTDRVAIEMGVIQHLTHGAVSSVAAGGRRVDKRVVNITLVNRVRLRIPIALFYQEE